MRPANPQARTAAQALEPVAVEPAEQEAISSGVPAPPIETPTPSSTDASPVEAQGAAAQSALESQIVVPIISPEEPSPLPSSMAAQALE